MDGQNWFDKLSDSISDIPDKIDDAIDEQIEKGRVRSSTVKMVKGAGKITYGLARGGLALSGAFGHGLMGVMMRRHRYDLAAKMMKSGMDAAKRNIDRGEELFRKGLDERRNK